MNPSRPSVLRPLRPAAAALAACAFVSGCVVAPVGPPPARIYVPPPGPAVVVAPPGLYAPPGVVYAAPYYPAPGPGWGWAYHGSHGWGWRHPGYGWHRGWR